MSVKITIEKWRQEFGFLEEYYSEKNIAKEQLAADLGVSTSGLKKLRNKFLTDFNYNPIQGTQNSIAALTKKKRRK